MNIEIWSKYLSWFKNKIRYYLYELSTFEDYPKKIFYNLKFYKVVNNNQSN